MKTIGLIGGMSWESSIVYYRAINEAIRDWITRVEDTHYLIGSAVGPHPYPAMVRSFQSVIGVETRRQILEADGNRHTERMMRRRFDDYRFTHVRVEEILGEAVDGEGDAEF